MDRWGGEGKRENGTAFRRWSKSKREAWHGFRAGWWQRWMNWSFILKAEAIVSMNDFNSEIREERWKGEIHVSYFKMYWFYVWPVYKNKLISYVLHSQLPILASSVVSLYFLELTDVFKPVHSGFSCYDRSLSMPYIEPTQEAIPFLMLLSLAFAGPAITVRIAPKLCLSAPEDEEWPHLCNKWVKSKPKKILICFLINVFFMCSCHIWSLGNCGEETIL